MKIRKLIIVHSWVFWLSPTALTGLRSLQPRYLWLRRAERWMRRLMRYV